MSKYLDESFCCGVYKGEEINAAVNLGSIYDSLCPVNKSSIDSIFKCVVSVPISMTDYATRLGQYLQCSPAVFVVAHILTERLHMEHPEYFCPLSAHKLLCTSILLAIKYTDDIIFCNSFYGEIFGVSLGEINDLEINLLKLLKFQLFVDPEFVSSQMLSFTHPWSQKRKTPLKRSEHYRERAVSS
eukprot:c9120_g1_i1.p1 GENE.c9120_g1_i1~~c9120_g1_i1.p1  ORF type:complete len:186 (+),score=40.96 c9120_g1_i1:78-635(+)